MPIESEFAAKVRNMKEVKAVKRRWSVQRIVKQYYEELVEISGSSCRH